MAGSTVDATAEGGEPRPAGTTGHSVWYTWTAPASGRATFDTYGTTFDTHVAVYTGTRVDRLTLVASADNGPWSSGASWVEFTATAGVAYKIQVDGMLGATGAFSLTWNRRAPPNDDFANAQSISGETGSIAGNNVLATVEAGERAHLAWGPNNSIWYRWTSPFTGRARFDTAGSAISAWVAAYRGSSLAGATWLAGNDGYPTYEHGTIVFDVQAGVEYRVVIDSYVTVEGDVRLNWRRAQAPANDDFANARLINGLRGTVDGDTYGAGAEPGEPGHYAATPVRSIWYRWMPQHSGSVRFWVTGNRWVNALAVYEGTTMSTIRRLDAVETCCGDTVVLETRVEAGRTYHVAIDTRTEWGYPVQLSWVVDAPDEDSFSRPLWLGAATSGAVTRSTVAATKEPGEPAHAGNAGGASVWVRWFSDTAGSLTLDTVGSGFDTLVGVYTGASVSGLSLVGADDDSGGAGTSRVTVHVDAERPYFVAIDGKDGAMGEYVLRWSLRADPPPNDSFADAQLIAQELGSITGRTLAATHELGEPVHAEAGDTASVWYRWVAPTSGRAVFDTFDTRPCDWSLCPPETDFDSVVAVYRGSAIGALTPVAANDDQHDPVWGRSRVSFPVVAGETYRIAVDVGAGAEGDFVLNWVVAPHNDDFAAPQIVTGASGDITGSTIGSTWEGVDGNIAARNGANVWYLWRAPATATMAFETSGSSWTPLLSIVTGNRFELLRSVRAVASSRTVVFDAIAGTTYRLAVAGNGSGVFRLSWRPATRPPELQRPANDDFVDAQPIGGSTGSVAGTTVGATLEAREPGHYSDAETHASVWYRWTAPAAGTVVFDTAVSSPGTVVAAYAGLQLEVVERVAGGFNWFDSRSSAVRVGVTAGVTYSIAVAKVVWESGGPVTLNWRYTADAPVNDNLGAAQRVDGSLGSIDGTTSTASREWGEPLHAGYAWPAATVWYSWTAPATAPVGFSTTSAYDTILAAYRTDADGFLVEVAANNDDAARASDDSRVGWRAVAGTTYLVAVGIVNAGAGPFTLTWRQPPSPPNDAFASAGSLGNVWTRVVFRGDTFGATREAGEPAHAGVLGNASIWYRWTYDLGWTRTYTLTTAGSDFDTLLAVYTGSTLADLELVASDDDSAANGASRVTFQATSPHAGATTYWIAVDGKGGASGNAVLSLSDAPVPPNDHFAAAAPISGATGSVSGSVVGASLEPGEPRPPTWSGGSVWYRWVAPTSGTWRFELADATYADVGVYVGERVHELVELATTHADSFVSVPVVAGRTYSIVVSGGTWSPGGPDGTHTLGWRPSAAPAHDAFAAARPLSGAAGVVTDSTAEASVELSEPLHAGADGGASLWYRWTAPSTGTAVFDTAGTSFDDVVAVYTGSQLSRLTLVAANDDFAGELDALVRFDAVAGTTYFVAVDGANGGGADPVSGPLALAWHVAVPPPNDYFAAAQVVAGESGSAAGTTFGARPEPGEPSHAERASRASVWYRWTAPATATYRFDLAGSESPVLLGVYTGSAVSALTLVRRSDDRGTHDEAVDVAAAAGTTYSIAIDGAERATGGVRLAWSRTTPANDAFADAAAIAGRSGVARAVTRGATREPGEPVHAGTAGGASVWYRWVAPATEVVAFDTGGSDFDTTLAAYTGSSVDTITAVASSDDASSALTSALRVHAVRGTTYRIAIDGARGAAGNAVLSWAAVAAPTNDRFAGAAQISGRSGEVDGTTLAASREHGEPDHARALGRNSVWYRFKAVASGTVVLETTHHNFDAALAAYTGTSVGSLTLVAADAGSGPLWGGFRGARIRFAVVEHAEYAVAVDGAAAASGAFRLVWRLPPANDGLANAQPLSGVNGEITGTTDGASAEPAENNEAANSVWYRWTAPETGTYAFELTRSVTPQRVAIYGGTTFASLTPAHAHGITRFGATAGATYSISVDPTIWERAGTFTLSWRRVAGAPSNDVFAAAEDLSGSVGTATAPATLASLEPGEPTIGATKSVWYRWVAPATGRLYAETRGTNGDSSIWLATGGPTPGGLTVIASGSGAGGAFPFYGYLDAPVAGGTAYYLLVRMYDATSAQVTWKFDPAPPANGTSNDLFANGYALSGTDGRLTSSNVGATKEPGEPNHAGNTGGKSVWFTWRAPASGATLFQTVGCSDLDSLLGVYVGNSVSSLSLIVANNDLDPTCRASSVTFNATAGTVYRVVVDGYNGAQGPFTLLWSGQPADTVAPDTRLTTAPPATTSATSATFAFSSSEAGSRFECSLDGAAFVGCAAPVTYAGLAAGAHRFAVRAIDAAGNVEWHPAAFSWTVVAAPPNDAFAAAVALAGATGSVVGTTAGAAVEPGEPSHGTYAGGGSVWYAWTSPRDGRVTFGGDAMEFGIAVSVYTASGSGGRTK